MKQWIPAERAQSPCYECPDMEPGCHDKCGEFLEFKDIHDMELRTIRENKRKRTQTYWTLEQKKSAKDFNSNVWKQTKK